MQGAEQPYLPNMQDDTLHERQRMKNGSSCVRVMSQYLVVPPHWTEQRGRLVRSVATRTAGEVLLCRVRVRHTGRRNGNCYGPFFFTPLKRTTVGSRKMNGVECDDL